MDRTTEQLTFHVNDEVFGADGGKLGTITAVHPLYLVIAKGFIFSTDYYIPRSAVANCENGKVTLFVSKNTALDQGWDRRPADDTGDLLPGPDRDAAGDEAR
jgi:hypothetical protein